MMNELAASIARMASCERLLVASDFDGTLAEFVDDPRKAEPAAGVMASLLGLASCPGTTCAIISARETEDLAERLAHPAGLLLAGSYGQDILQGAGVSPAGHRQLRDATTALEGIASRYPGAWVERKRHAVVLHVRQVGGPLASIALAVARASLAPFYGLQMIGGEQAVEWCAFTPDKALAMDVLRRRTRAQGVIFAGDGDADEAVFTAAQSGDMMIKVGAGSSVAPHRVEGPKQMAWLLQSLLEARAEFMRAARRIQDISHPVKQPAPA